MTAVNELRFRAMGSDAHLTVVGGPSGLLEDAVRRIDQLEQRWSRFIDSSEICELNRRAGSDRVVSADTLLLVERAIEAWRLTGGGFDPTVLGSVLRAGYDVSFDEMCDNRAAVNSASTLLIGCTDIRVDGQMVRLPAGTGFDPGGIGRDWQPTSSSTKCSPAARRAHASTSEAICASPAAARTVSRGRSLSRIRGPASRSPSSDSALEQLPHRRRCVGVGQSMASRSTT